MCMLCMLAKLSFFFSLHSLALSLLFVGVYPWPVLPPNSVLASDGVLKAGTGQNMWTVMAIWNQSSGISYFTAIHGWCNYSVLIADVQKLAVWALPPHCRVLLYRKTYLQVVMELFHRWATKEDDLNLPFSPLTVQQTNMPNLDLDI